MDFFFATGVFALVFIGALVILTTRGGDSDQKQNLIRRMARPDEDVDVDITRKTRVRESSFEQRENRLRQCARNLTLPTLLVRGEISNVLSDEGAQDFLALCPHAEYFIVKGAAHMVAGDRNDIFANAARDFLVRSVPTREVSRPPTS